MISFLLSTVLSFSLQVSAPSACETYAPRLDGISVTVCNGSVVRYTDASGNVSEVSGN